LQHGLFKIDLISPIETYTSLQNESYLLHSTKCDGEKLDLFKSSSGAFKIA